MSRRSASPLRSSRSGTPEATPTPDARRGVPMDPRPLHEPVCEGEGEGEANRSTTLPPSQEEEPPPRWNACDLGLGLGRITAFPVFPRTKQTARINRFTGRQQPPRMMPTRPDARGVEAGGVERELGYFARVSPHTSRWHLSRHKQLMLRPRWGRWGRGKVGWRGEVGEVGWLATTTKQLRRRRTQSRRGITAKEAPTREEKGRPKGGGQFRKFSLSRLFSLSPCARCFAGPEEPNAQGTSREGNPKVS